MKELSEEELEQVAGGKIYAGGVGFASCLQLGAGLGGGVGAEGGGLCIAIGIGLGGVACLAVGESSLSG